MDGLAGGSRLFVYGTLRSNFENPYARRLRSAALLLGTATVSGAIFDLGRYPGYRSDLAGEVTGELYELGEPDSLLAVLDDYEGPEYRRILINVAEFGPAWIYELVAVPPNAPQILSGDYLTQ